MAKVTKITARLRQRIQGKTFYRKLRLDRKKADEENRIVPASLSSEYPVERFFGTEVLLHGSDNVNLERAEENGLPLLLGHNTDPGSLVGRARNVRIKGKRLHADLHFSDSTERARETWAQVKDGFLTDISIGYSIEEVRETSSKDDNLIEVTRWTVDEGSLVTVPADHTVGANRGKRGTKMVKKVIRKKSTDRNRAAAKPRKRASATITQFRKSQESAKADGKRAGTRQERLRVTRIMEAFAPYKKRRGVAELEVECLERGYSSARSGALLLEFLAEDPEPTAGARRQSEGHHGREYRGGADELEKWMIGTSLALELRAGLIKDPEEARKARADNQFTGMSLNDLARDYLVRVNADIQGFGRQQIVGLAFTRAGMHSTSDFANLLENTARKSMLIGFDEAPETWAAWAAVGNLQDFKAASRINISTFSDLEQVIEGGEYEEGHISDLKETIQLGKYGKLFTISREAIINDDMDGFTKVPRAMGRAANRKIGDVAYAVLTANAALNQDSVTLFNAAHNNLGTGGVITESTLDEFMRLMSAQRAPAPAAGEQGAVLNMTPKHLLVPRAIVMTARKVIETPTAPIQGTNTGDLTVNTQANRWNLVSDQRLDADSTTRYYGLADQNLFDTIEVAFLDGQQEPYMESQDGFKQDGVTYKVRTEVAAAAMDFRGAVRNAGV